MNLDDFSYIDNDRRYVNPQVSLNEQNAFIDNLRNTQGQDTAQIRQDTYNLGTAVPSNLGGLAGGSNYFKSRYQTPQTNSMVADLRAAAQSQALSTLLNNEIGKAKKRYSDAYRAAKKRANNISSGYNPNNYLEKLVAKAEDDGSGGIQGTKEADDESLASSPSREALLENARINQRIWENQLASWNNKNVLEALWTMDERNNAAAQTRKWRDKVKELEAMGN